MTEIDNKQLIKFKKRYSNINVNSMKDYSTCECKLKSKQNIFNLIDFVNALKHDEFIVYYQPKINSLTNELVGLEALVRWNHPTKKIITPGCFLPVASSLGILSQIDKVVIEKSKIALKKLKSLGYKHSISVNVNFSELDLILADDIGDLEVEITEMEMAINVNNVKNQIDILRNQGTKILIDDFGTGYSSLKYLQDFHIDVLKIDKVFVDNIGKDTRVLEGIIALAGRMKYSIIAEGVEEPNQIEWLKNYGVYIIQGYFYDKPNTLEYIINKYI